MAFSLQQLQRYQNVLESPLEGGLSPDPYLFIESIAYLSKFHEGRAAINILPREKRQLIETKLLKEVPLEQNEISMFYELQKALLDNLTVIKTLLEDGIDPEEKQQADISRNTVEAINSVSTDKEQTRQQWKQTKEAIIKDWIRFSKADISDSQRQELERSLNKLNQFTSSREVFLYLDTESERITTHSPANYLNNRSSVPVQEYREAEEAITYANNRLALLSAMTDTVEFSSRDVPFVDPHLPAGKSSYPDMRLYLKAQAVLHKDPRLKQLNKEREQMALLAVNAAALSQSQLPDSLMRNDPEIAEQTLRAVLEQKFGVLNDNRLTQLIGDTSNPETVQKTLRAVLFIDAAVTAQENKTTKLARLFFESTAFDQFQQFIKKQAQENNSASLLGITQELFSSLTTAAQNPETNTFLPYIMGIYLSEGTGKPKSLLEQLLNKGQQAGDNQLLLLEGAKEFVFASLNDSNNKTIYIPHQFLLSSLLSQQNLFFRVANRFFSFGNYITPDNSTKRELRSVGVQTRNVLLDGLSVAGRSFPKPFSLVSRVLGSLFSPSPGRMAVNAAAFFVKKNPVFWIVTGVIIVLITLIILPQLSSLDSLQRNMMGESIQTGGGGGTNYSSFVCEADDPSCQPCDPTTESCSWPVNNGCITNGPGPQHKTSPGGAAIDINARFGTGVTATHDGVVVGFKFTDPENKFSSTPNYGNYVKIRGVRAGKTFYTIYSHLRPVDPIGMFNGLPVKSGEVIGFVDNTGYSFGTHLHYEVIGLPLEALFPFPTTRGTCVNR